MPDGTTLREMVVEELEWEPSIDAAHIGVMAKNGVVTLNGFVESYAAKAAAERAASRVQGVKAIAEEIEVRLPNAQKHGDDEIAERVLRILTWDIEVPHERIRVKVEHGVVTLSGEVNYQFQRTAAETSIRRLGGVRDVVNLIHVKPVLPPTNPDVVQFRIENALRRNAEVKASRIGINVQDNKVILRGQVRTWFERNAAENAAWGAPGVVEVRNELRVQP